MTSTGRLAGKVAIVAGGGSQSGGSVSEGIGNGRAGCILFAREGARVAVVDRTAEAAEHTVRLITDEGGEAMAVVADATDRESCAAAVRQVVDTWGTVDILLSVIGATEPIGNVVDVDLDEFDKGMELNTKPLILMARNVIPIMTANGGGSIISISSIGGLVAHRNVIGYAMAKGGMMSLTRALAADHGEDGIRVNSIAPGLVHTPMATGHVAAGVVDDALLERRRQRSMLKTEGTGWDVGYAALFLASDESRWITAQTLVVDAGATSLFAF